MIFGVVAYAVLALHVAFAVWVFAGGFIARRARSLFRLHMASVAWSLFAVITGFPCPLTQLENHFRSLGGLTPYAEECIPHYVWIPLGISKAYVAVALLITPALVLNYLAYRPRRTTA